MPGANQGLHRTADGARPYPSAPRNYLISRLIIQPCCNVLHSQRPTFGVERVNNLAHPEQRREGQPHDAPAWRAAKHEGTVADSFLQAFNVKYFP